jgi:eukaryotic-like serine/threonine-protein kinase
MTERFEIEADVGSGGMASVVRARDADLGRMVAIKRLHRHIAAEPGAAERFKREALSAAALSHPGIVTVHDVGEDEGGPFIVMEFVDGETLTDLLKRQGPLDPVMAAGIALQVARALDHAHGRGVIHRDVKPGNILIDGSGAAKLADFGIATGLAQQERFTEVGHVLGTIAYLAPERVAGETATPASDLYALGVVLYEMLTGRIPFDADTPGAMIAAQQEGRFEPPGRIADVPPALEAIVLEALSTDPADRVDSAEDFSRQLEDWLADPEAADVGVAAADSSPTVPLVIPDQHALAADPTAVIAATPPPPTAPTPSRRRSLWPALVAGIALGALLVLAVGQLSPVDPEGMAATTIPADDGGTEGETDPPEAGADEPEETTTTPEPPAGLPTAEQAFGHLDAMLSAGLDAGAIDRPAFNALMSLGSDAWAEWQDDDPEDAAEALAEFDLRAIDEFLRGRIGRISTLVDLLVQTQLIREVAGLPEHEIEGRGGGRND